MFFASSRPAWILELPRLAERKNLQENPESLGSEGPVGQMLWLHRPYSRPTPAKDWHLSPPTVGGPRGSGSVDLPVLHTRPVPVKRPSSSSSSPAQQAVWGVWCPVFQTRAPEGSGGSGSAGSGERDPATLCEKLQAPHSSWAYEINTAKTEPWTVDRPLFMVSLAAGCYTGSTGRTALWML